MQQDTFPSSEAELISRMQEILGSPPGGENYHPGIGDDAAVRHVSGAGHFVVTTDLSVEHVHFSREYITMEEIGYRAMVSNLSDCAAMGALPDGAFVQLVIPRDGDRSVLADIEDLYTGFSRAGDHWDFQVAGGDISTGTEWVIGITLIGRTAPGERILLRKGAVPEDGLWVTGVPGRSAAGLKALQKWGRAGVPEQYKPLLNAHIAPVPRIELGRQLAADSTVHAMMDLSDGLSKDCQTLSRENGCGVILSADSSQPSEAMIQLSCEISIPWQRWFLHGGEDYELLFTASADFNPVTFENAVNGASILRIGTCTDVFNGVVTDNQGTFEPLPVEGFDHIGRLLK
jgi:thiamine-monophosphate kinase